MPASRSLIALLIGTVAFFALWVFALKGSSSSSPSSPSQGLGQYQSAINKAHQAVQTSNASNAASGNDGTPAQSSTAASSGGAAASHPTSSTPAQSTPAAGTSSKRVTHLTAKVGRHNKATLARLSTVQHALKAHKVVAMLFYNPAGADDSADKQELASVSTHHGQVVKLSIPLSEASNFTPVTQQVPVNSSPTLVLIAPNGQAGQIVGFSDQFEIAQRVDDALATK